MNFLDITYCRADGCTSAHDCRRHLTPEVKANAKRAGLPIAQFVDPKELECYTTKKEEKTP